MQFAFSETLQRWMDTHTHTNEPLTNFFNRILKDDTLSEQFLDLVVRNPRDNETNFNVIRSIFAKNEDFLKWFYGKGGYVASYEEYTKKQITKAGKIEDVLVLIPNFTPWALVAHFGNKFKIGEAPEEFVDEENLKTFIHKVSESTAVERYNRFKLLECNPKEFAKAYPDLNLSQDINKLDLFALGNDTKKELKKECGDPFEIRQGGNTFTVEFLANPFTSKTVFKVTAKSGKTFILKMLPYNFLEITSDRIRKEQENNAIRADSIYSNSLLEFYLKLNNCPHAPKICYYNYPYEAALYEAETGALFPEDCADSLDFHLFNAKFLKEANLLGVYVNDINSGNFIRSNEDGQIKIIDIGHAAFINPLTPGIPGLTFSFGNLCGRDYASRYA